MMWLQTIITIYHLRSFRGSGIRERLGRARAQGLYEAAVKPSLGCIIQRLSWGSGICFQDLPPPWLATWCWLLAGGLSLSFSGLFPALLENVVTGFPQGERGVCVCERESAPAGSRPCYDLASDITWHNFCHVPLVRSESLNPCSRGRD